VCRRRGRLRELEAAAGPEMQRTLILDIDSGAPRVQRLVEGVLLQWAAASAGGGSAHLAERVEELFLEASMLEAVRRSQVRS